MRRDQNAVPIRALVIALSVAVFAVACGSGEAGSADAGSTPTSVPVERAVDDQVDGERETSSIPFVVLAEDLQAGDPYSVQVVADSEAFASLNIDDPGIDFSAEVVFVFDLAESNNPECWFQPTLQLIYDEPHQSLYPLVLMEGQSSIADPVVCDTEANPHRVVLSVARSDLPPSAFSLWVNGDDPPECCADRLVFVAEGELTRLDGPFPPLDAQGSLAVGETRILYGLSTHCGVDPIFQPIDGSQWTAADPTVTAGIDPMPPGWVTGETQVIDLVVERTGEDTLVVTALETETSVEYERSDEDFGCD